MDVDIPEIKVNKDEHLFFRALKYDQRCLLNKWTPGISMRLFIATIVHLLPEIRINKGEHHYFRVTEG